MPADGSQPLLGRDRELTELHAALRSAESGKGTLVLVVGEPGIGKTRLANDFASAAGASGAQVTWGRAWEAGGAPAYWPWIEALRPFATLAARASDAERARIAPLAHLLPELEGCQEPKPAADPAQHRFRLFEAVAAFLSLVARESFGTRLVGRPVIGRLRRRIVRDDQPQGGLPGSVAGDRDTLRRGGVTRRARHQGELGPAVKLA